MFLGARFHTRRFATLGEKAAYQDVVRWLTGCDLGQLEQPRFDSLENFYWWGGAQERVALLAAALGPRDSGPREHLPVHQRQWRSSDAGIRGQ